MSEPNKPVPEHFSSADMMQGQPLPEEGDKLPPIVDTEKQSRKLVILIILIALCVCAGIFMFCSRQFNSFDRLLKTLQFDYRAGETVDENTPTELGTRGKALAAQMQDSGLSLHAVLLYFNDKAELAQSASEIDYTWNADGETLESRTGVSSSMFTGTDSYRRQNGLTEIKKGSGWETANRAELPALRDLCFAAANRGNVSVSCYDSYRTVVGTAAYTCEIWLISSPGAGGTDYFTVYRYYSENDLAAVRIINSTSDIMEVYDVQSYSFQ